jgi:hypothetical protein
MLCSISVILARWFALIGGTAQARALLLHVQATGIAYVRPADDQKDPTHIGFAAGQIRVMKTAK